MAAKVAQILDSDRVLFYGKDLKVATGQTTIEPGMLVQLESSGSTVAVSGSTAATRPFGMAWGHRHRPYTPTTEIFAAGEPLTVAKGHFLALLSSDFFDGTVPSTPQTQLYGANNGKFTTAVTSNTVGRFLRTTSRIEPVSGIGASQTLYMVEVNIEP